MRLLPSALAIVLALTLKDASIVAAGPATLDTSVVQQLVDELRTELSIPNEVAVHFVDSNPLLVSVEVQRDRQHAFVLLMERGFLTQLEDDDLRAVIAHELGHVWIYTHHPFLQTERGANDIAMRVVSRESLLRVYEKVWHTTGVQGEPERFVRR